MGEPSSKKTTKDVYNGKIKIDLKKLKKYASQGKSKRRIARHLGISHETFYQKLKNTDFSDAYEEGVQEYRDWEDDSVLTIGKAVVDDAIKGTVSQQHFVLKALGSKKWNPSTKVEHSGFIGMEIDESEDGKDELT
jgi:hypothetical protein